MLKQKLFQKVPLIKKLPAFLLLSFLAFFHFGIVPQAQAACSYDLKLEATPANVRTSDNVTLKATIKRSQNLSDCSSSVNVAFQYKTKSGATKNLKEQTATFSGDTATTSYTLQLGSSYSGMKSDLADPSKIPFSFYAGGIVSANTRSNEVIIGVSGATDLQGNISVKFNPFKNAYTIGDNLNIDVSAQSFNLDPGITSIFLTVKVNGANPDSVIKQETITRKQFFDGYTIKNIGITTANKFTVGVTNSIRVEAWQAGTSLKISEAVVNVQVVGSASDPAITISPLKQSYNPGEDLQIDVKNIPSGSSGYITVNGQQVRVIDADTKFPILVKIDATNKFNLNGVNSVEVKVGTTVQQFSVAVGQAGSNNNQNNNQQNNSNNVDCNNPNLDEKTRSQYCLYNPLPTDELTYMFIWLIRGFFGILAIWATGFIIIGAFRMVAAQGNEEAYAAAKKTITWAVIGLVIGVLSFSIIAIVQNILGAKVLPAIF